MKRIAAKTLLDYKMMFLLFLLFSVLTLSSCVTLPEMAPTNSSGLPIDARLASFIIQPFDSSRIQQRTLKSMGSVEGDFRDQLLSLVSTNSFFNPLSSNEIHLKVELISWRDASSTPLIPDMEVVVKYTFHSETGTPLMTKTFTSKGQSSGLWLVGGIYRHVRAANDSFAENLEQFGESITKELPTQWAQHSETVKQVYAKSNSATIGSRRVERPQAVVASSSVRGLGQYHALVIGNNTYAHLPSLKTAVNDANALARALETDYGFKLKVLKNATRAEILRAMNDYRRSLTHNDNLLIYYAGHGWLDDEADEGYWLPVDADRVDSINWISNSAITNNLRAMKARHVLVVADSCYAGKLTRGIKLAQRGDGYYEQISQKRSRTVLASGGLEPVADGGGKGNHSIFTSEILKSLKSNQGLMDGAALFAKIQRPVILNSEQKPEYSDIRKAGHDGGDFIFAKTDRR